MAGVVPDGIRAIVLYVLNPSGVTLNDLPWTVCCKRDAITGKTVGFVVYRGQSSRSNGAIPRLGSTPNEIRLDMSRPISTSTELNQHIESFAAPPGRLFLIHVTPGIKYINVKKAISDYSYSQAPSNPFDLPFFESIREGLPATSGFKGKKPSQIAGEFWRRLAKEKEVILSPENAKFASETGAETWERKEAMVEATLTEVYMSDSKEKKSDGKPLHRSGQPTGVTRRVKVYETGLSPLRNGRGRTFRRTSKRRNKNGRRLTRQSKHHVRNGDA
jgi:hypothetical protein